MKKRILSLLLALTLILGLTPAALGAPLRADPVQPLLASLSAQYAEASGEWHLLDMAAYEAVTPSPAAVTTDDARQTYIDTLIPALTEEGVGEAAWAKAILVLQSQGADPQALWPRKAASPISAVAGLLSLETHSPSAWVAPYTLAALNQGDYGTQALEEEILSAVLAAQNPDGSWTEWGDSIQTTANQLAGLAFYTHSSPEAAAAADRAVDFLSAAQGADGSFDAYGTGPDANTAAMVVIGLAALGIDPHSDPRFVKNGASALDALLSFALDDNSGFGYTDNTTFNAYSSEQAFRALVAYTGLTAAGGAFNVYDFSSRTVTPAYESAPLPFTDLEGHWAAAPIGDIWARGLMQGTSETAFSPEEPLSRAMLATILYRLEGEPAVTAAPPFNDVPEHTWYTDGVTWAAGAGIVTGLGKDRFAPGDAITREQIAVMLHRSVLAQGGDPSGEGGLGGFADVSSVSPWALEAMAWANGAGLITGRSGGILAPQAPATRAEAAAILSRWLGSSH